MTQIGLMLEGQFGLTWERWIRLLDAAERLGYAFMFRSDHYTIGTPEQESLETFISLTYAADHTRRIEFGPMVAPVTFRHPALAARMAAQIDDLSNGRFVFGIGAGWHEREHTQFGIPFYDFTTRFEMYEEALELTERLFNSNGQPVSFQGKHYSLKDAVLLPVPKRPGGPPILIGGKGWNKTLPLAARYADEWNAAFTSPSEFGKLVQRLNDLLAERGREASSVKKGLMTQVVYGKDDADLRERRQHFKLDDNPDREQNLIVGTPQQVIDRIGEYVDAGCQRFMLQWLDLDDLDRIEHMAGTVVKAFHG